MFFSKDWRLNLCIFIVIFIILWVLIGRRNDCQFVGLRPLSEKQQENDESLFHQISFSSECSDDESIIIENPHSLNDLIGVTLMPDQPTEEKKEESVPAQSEFSPVQSEFSPAQEESVPDQEESAQNIEIRHHTIEEYINRANPQVIEHLPYPINEPNKKCRRWKGEEYCCMALENIVGHKVQRNIRPEFLKNPETCRNLELDCFDPETNIAIEYNGIQHYEYPNIFHQSEKIFQDQVYRDTIKNELCQKNGITLITVPYTVDEKLPAKSRYLAIYNYIRSHFQPPN